jgi:hypothetical protein
MASFVHIADEKKRKLIEKNGVARQKRGVFCMPVTKDFSITHQWSRELKRTGVKSLVCIQFRVSDDEIVSVGMYNGGKMNMTAAESVATIAAHTAPMGLEVIFDRKILAKEITRIYDAPKVTGWRYHPDAKGKKPFCHCRFCNRGEIRAQRLIRENAE